MHSRGIRRRKIIGNQDNFFLKVLQAFGAFTQKIAQDPAAYIIYITYPLLKILILDIKEHLDVFFQDILKHIGGGKFFLLKLENNLLNKHPVFQDQEMRVKYFSHILTHSFGNFFLQV